MANYEQKIFEQVIDTYIREKGNLSTGIENEGNLNGISFKIKEPVDSNKEENIGNKKSTEKKKRESKSKAVLIEAEYHENLPKDWKKVVVQRTTGATAGKFDVYFFTPSGRKLRSKNEIKDYSDKHNLNLDLANFGFSRPKREKVVCKVQNKKCRSKISPPVVEKEGSFLELSDSSNTNVSECLSNSQCVNVPVLHSSKVEDSTSIDNLFSNFDEDIKSLTEGFDTTAELDLPNTSFSKSSSSQAEVLSSIESGEFDIDQTHLGKTFKIERPISFSCF